MSFSLEKQSEPCPLCGSQANIRITQQGEVVDCSQCGDFEKRYDLREFGSPIADASQRALASHLVRQLQGGRFRPILSSEFFESLRHRTLPSPIEAMDNFVLLVADATRGKPGDTFELSYDDGKIISSIGVCSGADVGWVVESLRTTGYLDGAFGAASGAVNLTVGGWMRYEQITSAQTASKFAFFARKFDNPELDDVYNKCLYDAVKATGYELRTASQKAGPVDAIIEDEIRRCRFLIADLSDGNNGAYWEAGFAEGLGKPVVYICRDKDEKTGEPMRTHFDTDHRHTVRWNVDSLDETAKRLKAVIRNTLLGDATQSDE